MAHKLVPRNKRCPNDPRIYSSVSFAQAKTSTRVIRIIVAAAT